MVLGGMVRWVQWKSNAKPVVLFRLVLRPLTPDAPKAKGQGQI